MPFQIRLRRAVVPQRPHFRVECRAGRCDHPALTGRDGLSGMEAEAASIAESAAMPIAIPRAEAAGGILDHPQAVAPRDIDDRVHVGAETEQVNRDDPHCSSRDLRLDLAWVDIERR